MNYEAVREVLAALEREGVRYVVFGGAALNLLGISRFTADLGLFLAPEAANIDALKRALRSVFQDPAIEEISSAELLGEYPAVQYVPPEGSFHIDVVTRLGEAFRYEDLEAQRVPLGDLQVAVVTPTTLHRMKRATVRLKDRADAEMLRQRFGIPED